jgi:integrase
VDARYDMDVLVQKWLAQSLYARNTRESYLLTLQLLARRYPAKGVQQYTEGDLITFLTQEEDGTPTRLAGRSILSRRTALRSFWSWCEAEGLIGHDPSRRLPERVKAKPAPVRTGRWLSRQEITALLDACPDTPFGRRDRVVIVLGLTCGLRLTELCKLTWDQLDFAAEHVHVTASSAKGRKAAVLGMIEQCRDLLLAWRAFHVKDAGRPPEPKEPVICAVVYSPNVEQEIVRWTAPLGQDSLRLALRKRSLKAGIGVVHPHDLRRTCAGLLEDHGCGLKEIQAVLRHSSPATTQQVYLDTNPRRAVFAVQGLTL